MQRAFSDLIKRVRAGDETAAEELFRTYEPHVRRVVRHRLRDRGIRRVSESMDVCQSVLAAFFVGTATGSFEFETPEQMLRLLGTMARNRVNNLVDEHHAQKRDARRLEPTDVGDLAVANAAPTPGSIIAGRELLQKFRLLLPESERQVAELRQQGHSWQEVAEIVGGEKDAVRIRFSRASEQALKQLEPGD